MVLKFRITPFDFFHLHNDLGLGIVIVMFCMREM